jgi:hypothetical protein
MAVSAMLTPWCACGFCSQYVVKTAQWYAKTIQAHYLDGSLSTLSLIAQHAAVVEVGLQPLHTDVVVRPFKISSYVHKRVMISRVE